MRPKTVDPSGRGVHHGQEVQDSQDQGDTHYPRQRDERGFLERIPDELTPEEEAHQSTGSDPPSAGYTPGVSPENGEQPKGHQANGTEQARKPAQKLNLLAVPRQLVAGEEQRDHGQNKSKAAAQHWTPPLPEGTVTWHGPSARTADLPGEGAARLPLNSQ